VYNADVAPILMKKPCVDLHRHTSSDGL